MKISLLPGGKAPTRATDGSGAFDCYVREVEFIKTHKGYGRYEPLGATLKLGFKLDCSHITHTLDGMNPSNQLVGMPLNFAALLMPRSGWGTKYGFRLLNTIGLIDSDYRGEVIAKVAFDECPPELLAYANDCDEAELANDVPMVDQPRVCQLAIVPVYAGDLTIVDKLDDTERGESGFGHSGAN